MVELHPSHSQSSLDQVRYMNSTADSLHVPKGPITRSKVKKIQEAYTLHLQKLASVHVETKTFEPKNLYSISISNGKLVVASWLSSL